jgi:hypothetical protein
MTRIIVIGAGTVAATQSGMRGVEECCRIERVKKL